MEANGENRIAVVPGANGAVDASDVATLRSMLTPGDMLLVQLEVSMAAVVLAVAVAATCRAVAVVVKLGGRGMCWAMGDQLGWQSALPVRVRDTVGAGDAGNGALACALPEGATLAEAVHWAAAAATRPGGYVAMPTRGDVLTQLGDDAVGRG